MRTGVPRWGGVLDCGGVGGWVVECPWTHLGGF
jgi:hypothetical protein